MNINKLIHIRKMEYKKRNVTRLLLGTRCLITQIRAEMPMLRAACNDIKDLEGNDCE